MRKNIFFWLLTIWSVTLWAPTSASAQAPKEGPISAAVLNLQGESVDERLVSTLSSIVRNEAQQLDKYQVVNKYEINFQDILLVLGCSADSPTCLKQAAEQVNARVLIFGNISRDRSDYKLVLRIFDSDSGRMINDLTRTIEGTNDPVVAIRKEIEGFFGKERAVPATRIQIGSNIRDAEILIEDTFVGTVPLERKGLPPGRYKVVVNHPDYEPWETILELKTGADVELWATLKARRTPVVAPTVAPSSKVGNAPEPVAATSPVQTRVVPDGSVSDTFREDDRISRPNWGAWSTISVGGLALAGSGIFALLMSNTETTIEDESAAGTLTERRYDDLVDKGESYELTHRVLLGVGAVAVIGGTVWLLVDDEGDGVAALELGLDGPTHVQATLRW